MIFKLFNYFSSDSMPRNVPATEVERAILEAAKMPLETCLAELRDYMNDFGFNFPRNRKGEKRAYKRATEIWWDVHEARIPIDEFPIVELDDLPETTIVDNGKTYHLHGIAHRQFPFSGMSQTARNFIRDRAESYHSPNRGHVCYYEDRFDKSFGIQNGHNFRDMDLVDQLDWDEKLELLLNVTFRL